MSGTDEPRIWTLNVQSEGQASWTLICRGWWLSPIETIEVVEKSAYDAAVERLTKAEASALEEHLDARAVLEDDIERAEAERDAAVERAERLQQEYDRSHRAYMYAEQRIARIEADRDDLRRWQRRHSTKSISSEP